VILKWTLISLSWYILSTASLVHLQVPIKVRMFGLIAHVFGELRRQCKFAGIAKGYRLLFQSTLHINWKVKNKINK